MGVLIAIVHCSPLTCDPLPLLYSGCADVPYKRAHCEVFFACCDHSHVLPLIQEAEAVSIIGGYEQNWFALLTFSYFCHHTCCRGIFTEYSATFETNTDVLLY